MPKATHLECSLCHNRLDAGAVANLCTCGGPLLVRYDLGKIRHRWKRREVPNGPSSMWRYAPLLPPAEEAIVTLGEGWTPPKSFIFTVIKNKVNDRERIEMSKYCQWERKHTTHKETR